MTAEVTAPGLYPSLHDVYHSAQLTPTRRLTQSGIKVLLDETPFDFANPTARQSSAMDLGSIVHALALDKGKKFVVAPFYDYRTKDARAWRDAAIADGLIPIKADDYADAKAVADIVKAKIIALTQGEPYETEVPFFWQEGETWCSGMLDVWCPALLAALDVKRTANLGLKAREHIANMGWDLQAAWYLRGLEAIFPQHAGRLRFANLLIKPKAPYTSRAVMISEGWRTSAERECERALDIFRRCMASGEWPGYSDGIEALDVPPWILNARMMAEMDASE